MEIVLVVVVAAAVAGLVAYATRPKGARYPAVGGAAAVPQGPVAVKASAPASAQRAGVEEDAGSAATQAGAAAAEAPTEAQVALVRAELDEELRTRRAEIGRIEERLLTKEESVSAGDRLTVHLAEAGGNVIRLRLSDQR